MNLSNSTNRKLLESNVKKGKLGEEIAKVDYAMNGFRIIPTGRGSDFIAKKPNESKKQQEYVEVKTGKSRPTKQQKKVMKMARKSGHRYTIYRVTNVFLESYLNSSNLRREAP